MAGQANASRGPFAVAMMALHDRAFFQGLLTDPRGAMQAMVSQGKLRLAPGDMDAVVSALASGQHPISPDQGMKIWAHWSRTGQIGEIDWPIRLWPSY
jgi:hypothetical protein